MLFKLQARAVLPFSVLGLEGLSTGITKPSECAKDYLKELSTVGNCKEVKAIHSILSYLRKFQLIQKLV
jgi:hypothetical protein